MPEQPRAALDAGKPFSVVLKLEPVTYYILPHVGVGCPAR